MQPVNAKNMVFRLILYKYENGATYHVLRGGNISYNGQRVCQDTKYPVF